MKNLIKFVGKNLFAGLIFVVGVVFTGVLIAYSATQLSNVEKGETLTAGTLNGIIDKVNELFNRTDGISSVDSKIGIGTNNPQAKLDVEGDLKVSNGRIIRNINVQVDTVSRNFGTSWGLGPTFDTIGDFKAGSLVRITYHVPMRNNSTSRGGGYIEPQISFDGGANWKSIGSSGYDGGVMNKGAESIGSYFNSILIDPEKTSDFSVKIRFYYRSRDGTVTVNGSNNINAVSGTAPLMSGVEGEQHYTKVIVEELY